MTSVDGQLRVVICVPDEYVLDPAINLAAWIGPQLADAISEACAAEGRAQTGRPKLRAVLENFRDPDTGRVLISGLDDCQTLLEFRVDTERLPS